MKIAMTMAPTNHGHIRRRGCAQSVPTPATAGWFQRSAVCDAHTCPSKYRSESCFPAGSGYQPFGVGEAIA
jgi:hypothetical protein